jgi:hypothetical protein
VYRRKLKLKAEDESSISRFSFNRFVPGAFNLGLIGSTCSALPWAPRWASPSAARRMTRLPSISPRPGSYHRSYFRLDPVSAHHI